MEIIKPGWRFDFMSKRKYFIGLTLVLLAISVVSFFYPGPKLGTDFRGGTEIEVAFSRPVTGAQIKDALQAKGFGAADVVAAPDDAHPHKFLIRVQEVSAISEEQKAAVNRALCLRTEGQAPPGCEGKPQATEVKFSPGGDRISLRYESAPDLDEVRRQIESSGAVKLRGDSAIGVINKRDHKIEVALQSKGGQMMDALAASPVIGEATPEDPLRVEWIGPKAGAQLRDAAIKSILIAIVFIMAYIAFRFDLRFAPGGIVALVHDVGIALGIMILTGREISLSTVAAMLTIVGYSITDTVVVYDRIRENFARHRNMTFAQIVNLSVSEMFGRTVISSMTTSLSMLAFLFFGTGVIKDFAFALLVGVLVGTYSSIYVAAPITEWIDKRFFGGKAKPSKKISRTRATKRADAVV